MEPRKIKDDIFFAGAVDWDRRLFDSLIPLPDGTSYNAYLIKGSEKTVLIDTVDPAMKDVLLLYLKDIETIDYIIAQHAEQDHSGMIPVILEKYKDAKVLASEKCKAMLIDHLHIPEESVAAVKDRETLSLGNKRLTFIHTPWVHWPETMVTYLEDDKILFTCDFFGSHLASTDLYATDEGRVYEAAKRYYSEIMMPFRAQIKKNMEKIKDFKIDLIAPSHGPIYHKPSFIVDAYCDWISDTPKNNVVIPYISMHGSTRKMVEYIVSSLAEKGITVNQFDLTAGDIGKIAITLVDAATIVIGTPTVHIGPHPLIAQIVYLANILRPKAKFASVIGSYGWGSKAVEQIAGALPNLKIELIDPVVCKGFPIKDDFKALDKLASTIAEKHREIGLL